MRLLILSIFLLGSSVQLTHVTAYKQEVKVSERQQGMKSRQLPKNRVPEKSTAKPAAAKPAAAKPAAAKPAAAKPAPIPTKGSIENNNATVKATQPFQPKAAPVNKPDVAPIKPFVSSIQQPWQPKPAPTGVQVSGTKNPVPTPTHPSNPSNPSNPFTPSQKQPNPPLSKPVNSKPTTSSPVTMKPITSSPVTTTKPTPYGGGGTQIDWYCGNRTVIPFTCSDPPQKCADLLIGCPGNDNNRDCMNECIPVPSAKPMKSYAKPMTLAPFSFSPF